MHRSVVPSSISISVFFSIHSSSHCSGTVITMSALQCGAVARVHRCVLLHPFISTSIENDREQNCIAVWCRRERSSLPASPPIHHHVDRKSCTAALHRSMTPSCMTIYASFSMLSSPHRLRTSVTTSASQCGVVVCVNHFLLLCRFIITWFEDNSDEDCIPVWCIRVCPSLRPHSSVRHHVDRA